jgi:site-specific DNA-methyltransferase (adenine-specific)
VEPCTYNIVCGDALTELKKIDSGWMHCAVTSPPYYRQRDYGHSKQLGQEATPEEFVAHLADVFDEVKRILLPEGSLWVNLDDSYHKGQMLGVPWMFAFEMKRRGWFLRCDNIWFKTSIRPEPVRNRNVRTHEYLFHFTKRHTGYYFDMDAVREPHTNPWVLDCLQKFAEQPGAKPRVNLFNKQVRHEQKQKGMSRAEFGSTMNPNGKAKRSLWLEDRPFRLKPGLTDQQIAHVLTELSKYGNPPA